MRQMAMLVLLVAAVIILAGTTALAAVPNTLTYQGRLTDADGSPLNGSQQITFSLYDTDSPAAPPQWSSGPITVQVDSGLFSCTLGATEGNPLPAYLFSMNTVLYLGVTVGTDLELTPRAQLTSSPWSMNAGQADNADMVDDLHATDFAPADHTHLDIVALITGHTHDAGDIVTGTFSDNLFSAFADLAAEGYLDNDAGDDLLVRDQLDARFAVVAHSHLELVDTLSNQDIWGRKSFMSPTDLANGDIQINHDNNILMQIDRSVNRTPSTSWGITLDMDNSAQAPVTGINCNVFVDNSYSTGLRGSANTFTPSSTSGWLYGVRGCAFYGGMGYGGYFECDYSLNRYGIYATCNNSTGNYGGYFYGNIHTTGTSTKGLGGFLIDHPDNPETEFLAHADVSSPDRMNIYNGNVVLDAGGKAVVQLPEYFQFLNENFRYQLTCVGGFAPVYVAEEISGNLFLIAGGEPGLKVSWQVTGTRKDELAKAMPLEVEKAKTAEDRGKFQNPEVFGRAMEDAVDYKHVQPLPETTRNEQGNR